MLPILFEFLVTLMFQVFFAFRPVQLYLFCVLTSFLCVFQRYLAETEHLKTVAAESSPTLKVLGFLMLLTGLGVGGYFAWKKYGQ